MTAAWLYICNDRVSPWFDSLFAQKLPWKRFSKKPFLLSRLISEIIQMALSLLWTFYDFCLSFQNVVPPKGLLFMFFQNFSLLKYKPEPMLEVIAMHACFSVQCRCGRMIKIGLLAPSLVEWMSFFREVESSCTRQLNKSVKSIRLQLFIFIALMVNIGNPFLFSLHTKLKYC